MDFAKHAKPGEGADRCLTMAGASAINSIVVTAISMATYRARFFRHIAK